MIYTDLYVSIVLSQRKNQNYDFWYFGTKFKKILIFQVLSQVVDFKGIGFIIINK